MADMALNANSIAESLPPGPWAVGVSGGADSVALLLLLKELPRVELHVVHLDHQTRGQESTADAAFVADLAQQLSIPAIIRRRDQFEPEMPDLSKILPPVTGRFDLNYSAGLSSVTSSWV